jgi:hypothetical protein
MAEEEIDPELQELFNELDCAQGELVESKVDSDEADSAEVETIKLGEKNSEDSEDSDDSLESALRPALQVSIESALEPTIDENTENTVVNTEFVEDDTVTEVYNEDTINELEARKNKLQFGLLGLVENHYENADRLIDDVEADRKKCDDVYDILLNKIRSDDYRGADITALVTLLQTKADISRTRASMMAEVSKLLAALRNNDSIGGKMADDSEITPDQLDKLIGGPEPDDG